MGNDIDNHFTIISDNKEQLTNIFNKFFNKLSNDCEVKLKKDKAIQVIHYSRNEPLIDIVDEILKNNNEVWVKNSWNSEDGHCGIAFGGYKSKTYSPLEVYEWIELDIDERGYYLM